MNFKRFTQITESHCGPAVLQMLLAYFGIEQSQEAITEAAEARETIGPEGTSCAQLALAIHRLAPEYALYFKHNASFNDVERLIQEFKLPAAVDWQGMFYEDEEEEDYKRLSVGDYGHYSIITSIDKIKNEVVMVDPYMEFEANDRRIEIYRFLNRWWDSEIVKDSKTGFEHSERIDKLLFTIAPRNNELTLKMGMRTYF